MSRVLGIVYRVIATQLVKKTGHTYRISTISVKCLARALAASSRVAVLLRIALNAVESRYI